MLYNKAIIHQGLKLRNEPSLKVQHEGMLSKDAPRFVAISTIHLSHTNPTNHNFHYGRF